MIAESAGFSRGEYVKVCLSGILIVTQEVFINYKNFSYPQVELGVLSCLFGDNKKDYR